MATISLWPSQVQYLVLTIGVALFVLFAVALIAHFMRDAKEEGKSPYVAIPWVITAICIAAMVFFYINKQGSLDQSKALAMPAAAITPSLDDQVAVKVAPGASTGNGTFDSVIVKNGGLINNQGKMGDITVKNSEIDLPAPEKK